MVVHLTNKCRTSSAVSGDRIEWSLEARSFGAHVRDLKAIAQIQLSNDIIKHLNLALRFSWISGNEWAKI